MTLAEIAAGVLSVTSGLLTVVTGLIVRRTLGKGRRQEESAEPTCSGYVMKMTTTTSPLSPVLGHPTVSVHHETKHDCRALRSAICLDGRCSYHCQNTCRCDKTERSS